MQPVRTIQLLVSVISAVIANDDLNSSTLSSLFAHSLTLTFAPNAIQALESHDLWIPDAESFADGSPNTTIDCTAEAVKFAASGLNINDLVCILIIDNNTEAATKAANGNNADCKRCDTCQAACVGLLFFLPFYGM